MLQCCCNFTTISVCQQLSKYNSVWLTYSKNKGVQFFCPTVYSYRLIESLHQVAGTQSLNRIDPVHPDRVVEEKSSRTHMYVNVNHKSRRAQSWRISTALYVLSGSVQNKFVFNNNCLNCCCWVAGHGDCPVLEFQTVGPATEKARRPTVLSR